MNMNSFFTTAVQRTATFLILGLAFSTPAQGTNLSFQAAQAGADKGDARAQFELARLYEKGTGVLQDDAKAFALMRQSAEQGYAPAEGQLGYYYGTGLGVGQDPVEALKWYRKSADQGDTVAQFGLGNI